MTSSWFFLSTLNYDARSTTHQIFTWTVFGTGVGNTRIDSRSVFILMMKKFLQCYDQNLSATAVLQNVIGNQNMTEKVELKLITYLVTLHYATDCIPFYHRWKLLQNFALITLTSISESLRLGERFHHSAEVWPDISRQQVYCIP